MFRREERRLGGRIDRHAHIKLEEMVSSDHALEMIERDMREAALLHAAVTTRGGTTAAALGVFDERVMQEILTASVRQREIGARS